MANQPLKGSYAGRHGRKSQGAGEQGAREQGAGRKVPNSQFLVPGP
ncbi:MAG: hypothetical protein RLZZ507_2317 [Cyanobacteriota bacterium]|jgi:hypothetical protein